MAEIEQFRAEWAQLKAEWAAMSCTQKRAEWERFTYDIDEGCAGWNRLHPILWEAYELGGQVLAEALN